jgi:hypothetical protein
MKVLLVFPDVMTPLTVIARWVSLSDRGFQLVCTLLDTGRQSVTVSKSGLSLLSSGSILLVLLPSGSPIHHVDRTF